MEVLGRVLSETSQRQISLYLCAVDTWNLKQTSEENSKGADSEDRVAVTCGEGKTDAGDEEAQTRGYKTR